MHEPGLPTSDEQRRATPDYFSAVKRALTPAVIERITEYAGRRADMLAAAGIRGAEGRMIAQDAMGEVILRRRWDQSRTLEAHLIGLIRQRTSNRLRQHERCPTSRWTTPATGSPSARRWRSRRLARRPTCGTLRARKRTA